MWAASAVARSNVAGLLKAAIVDVIAVPRTEAISVWVQGGGGIGVELLRCHTVNR